MKPLKKWQWIAIGLTASFSWIGSHLIYERNGGITAASANVWSDWAAHLAYMMHFAEKPLGSWFVHNPLYVGELFHYPFLINLVSAGLLSIGFSISTAMCLPTLICLIGSVWLAAALFKRVVPEGVAFALLIMFLGGSCGFIFFGRDLFNSENFLETLLFSQKQYAHAAEVGLAYSGHLTALLFPQRALQSGLFVALPLLVLLTGAPPSTRKQKVIAITVASLAGLLPIIHIHTLVCMCILLLMFSAFHFRNLWSWKFVLVPFAVVSILTWITFHRGGPPSSFFKWQPGWLTASNASNTVNLSWPVFWLWNWSVFLPLVIASLFTRKRRHQWIIYSGIAIFVLGNLVCLQPWDWDNTKIFFWSYVLMVPGAAHVLAKVQARNRFAAIILLLSLVSTAIIDLKRFITYERISHEMFSAREQRLAKKLKEMVPPDAVIASSSDPHDWVSSLAGRQIVMGYPGWLWTYGINYGEREKALNAIFSGATEGHQNLVKFGITHLVVDDKTRKHFKVNDTALERFTILFKDEGVSVYAASTGP